MQERQWLFGAYVHAEIERNRQLVNSRGLKLQE